MLQSAWKFIQAICGKNVQAETFDLLFSSMAIHNIPDAEGENKLLQRLFAFGKPGGRGAGTGFSFWMNMNKVSENVMERICTAQAWVSKYFRLFGYLLPKKPIVESKFEKLSFSTLL